MGGTFDARRTVSTPNDHVDETIRRMTRDVPRRPRRERPHAPERRRERALTGAPRRRRSASRRTREWRLGARRGSRRVDLRRPAATVSPRAEGEAHGRRRVDPSGRRRSLESISRATRRRAATEGARSRAWPPRRSEIRRARTCLRTRRGSEGSRRGTRGLLARRGRSPPRAHRSRRR
jgi:hypothetical protein